MAPFATYLIVFAFVVYGLVMLVELVRYQSFKTVAVQAVALGGVVLLLYVTTGFPEPDRSVSFGGGFSPLMTIGVMFVATLLGIAVRYYFYMREFSWRSFLKPLCITPIVLLPMMGSVHGSGTIDEIQLISFGFLAFQNGFFWKAVLEQAKRVIAEADHEEN